jgi:hypothetical protein
MVKKVSALVALASVLLAACSSGGHRRPTTTTSRQATATTTLRTTTSAKPPLSLAEATARYRPADAALEASLAGPRASLSRDTGNAARTRADYQALANAYRAFDQVLRRIRFPASAASDALQLLQTDVQLELFLQAAADATDSSSFASDQSQVVTLGGVHTTYRSALRKDLGMPALAGA